MGKQGRKWNKKGWILRLVVLVVLLFSCLTSGILAKYVKDQRNDASITAADFYFRSDLLTEEGESTSYVLNASTQKITLYLYNYADALRVSETNITCEVSATGGLTVALDTPTLSKNNASKIKVTVSGFETGKSYEITATGKGGYEQTLSASFTVRTVDSGFYQYVDTSSEGVLELLVWTGNVSGTATFTIPSGLLPDRRDPFFEGLVGNEVNFTIEKNSLQKFKFIVPSTYEGTPHFTVTLNGATVAEETLPSA